MKTRNIIAISAAFCALAGAILAAGVEKGNDKAPLGSTSYYPSAEHPVGWRGDGSGRFPGATPPTQWGRTIKGFYSELQCQAGKHKGDTKAGELLNMGCLRDWLIVGPFDTKDHKSGVDEEIIKDETTIQPQAGDKAGDRTWMKWNVSVTNQSQSHGRLVIDLAIAYGKTDRQEWQNHPGSMDPWLAYVQTGVWSPLNGKVRLRIEGNGSKKAWFNGEPVKMPGQYEASPTVDVKKGWNNLVVKVVASKGGWNFYAHVSPVPPYEYETRNIQWMTRMPGQSWCSPIIVGSKILVSADEGTLVCVNKTDGKVLWIKSTTYYHAVDSEEKKKFAELESKAKQLDDLCDELPNIINAAISSDGSKADKNDALNKKIKDKCGLEGSILGAMTKADKKKYETWGNDQDTSKYTPTSDGKYVYAVFHGGNKGLGANVVACFDLNGKRIWSYFTGQTGIGEHGTHCSPALSGNCLVYKSGPQLFGFEKETGKVAWQVKVGGGLGASTVPIRIGNTALAYVPQRGIYRASDGTQIWKAECEAQIPTPCVTDGAIYGIGDKDYFAFKLPNIATGESISLIPVAKTSWKEVSMHMPGTFTDSIVGSPLYDNGLIYIASEGGAWNVIDAKTGKPVYSQALDSLNPRLTWVFVVGICTGPTLGGKYIYIRDDQHQTLVLEPGPKYKEVAKNLLVEYDDGGHQPEAQSNFFFEGNKIYFRSRAYLYCIGEK